HRVTATASKTISMIIGCKYFLIDFMFCPHKSRFVDLFSLLLSTKSVILSGLRRSEVCRFAASEVKCSAYRAEGTLHAHQRASQSVALLHVPRKRNT
ncbi:MAG: hypothetical protein IJT60_06185, partial [Clostridia bacterium]|nr:hypothetical protein [Clostridia bacterium]